MREDLIMNNELSRLTALDPYESYEEKPNQYSNHLIHPLGPLYGRHRSEGVSIFTELHFILTIPYGEYLRPTDTRIPLCMENKKLNRRLRDCGYYFESKSWVEAPIINDETVAQALVRVEEDRWTTSDGGFVTASAAPSGYLEKDGWLWIDWVHDALLLFIQPLLIAFARIGSICWTLVIYGRLPEPPTVDITPTPEMIEAMREVEEWCEREGIE